jgi:hypothetical protein
MKLIITIVSIAVLSGVVSLFAPWWSVALVSFVVSLLLVQRPGRSFVAGFAGAGLWWLVAALYRDIPNDHLLSGRMAQLFHLPNGGAFIAITVVVGGLIGGLGAWAGGQLKKP